MKRFLLLLPLIALATACHSIQVTGPGGTLVKIKSFGQKTTIAGLSWSTNGVAFQGYNNDQVTLAQTAFQAGMAAAKAGAVP